jgi:hypothetical protein
MTMQGRPSTRPMPVIRLAPGRHAVVQALAGQRGHFEKGRARVEQGVDPVAGQQLAARQVLLPRLLGAAGAGRARRACRSAASARFASRLAWKSTLPASMRDVGAFTPRSSACGALRTRPGLRPRRRPAAPARPGALPAQAVGQRAFHALAGQLFHHRQALAAAQRHLVAVVQRRLRQLLRVAQVVDQAHRVRVLRRQPARREQQVERAAQADQPRQPLAAAPARHQAELRVLVTEARRRRGEDHVAGQHQFQPAGQAQAVAGRHHRQRAGFHAAQHAVAMGQEGRQRLGVLAQGLHLLQVGPGAELRALRAQQQHAHAAARRSRSGPAPRPARRTRLATRS